MLLSFDLAGAEWVVVAYLCRDPAMLDVVHSKKSPHVVTGSRMTGLSEDLVKLDNKLIGLKNNPIEIEEIRRNNAPELFKATFIPRTMSIRQAAKKANFGLSYREGFKTFALKNEIDEREARIMVSQYRDKAYPGIKRWYEEIDEQIRSTRTMENCFGRKIYFQGALNDDTFRAATAAIPQSTVFDCCGHAMGKYSNDDSLEFSRAFLLAQVHDSLLADYRSNDYSAMAAFCQKLAEYMRPPITYHGETFTLDVTLKAGPTWGSLHEIPLTRDLPTLSAALASITRQ